RGICALSFAGDEAQDPMAELAEAWPAARLVADERAAESTAARVFSRQSDSSAPLSVLVRGTNFQVAVWRALLEIPPGRLASYGDIARAIDKPKAVRAVGAAVGANPCAFVIPCHRVIRGNGQIGGYRWGLTRKYAINAWEAAATDGMLNE
ncbi:MAG: methylated-DNA--[protein]-cysteine S-methyltransferase, partial [Gammaproteobacteria bacterium]|nr:methylated-DNA--[protein]-cysteine S-methyltransferase [Gammaproteobacteria bacterium]